MDQANTSDSKRANEETPGSTSAPQTLHPVTHSQNLGLGTNAAAQSSNAVQSSQPIRGQPTHSGQAADKNTSKSGPPPETSKTAIDAQGSQPPVGTPALTHLPTKDSVSQPSTDGKRRTAATSQGYGAGLPEQEEVEKMYLGLRELVVPDSGIISLDIIFIHGLAAHPNRTWRHKKTQVNWLNDPTMLPKHLPHARILTFGYQSRWYGEDSVRMTVNTAATSLLHSLMGELREDYPQRPIIVVAHCFGGLIIQRALYTAHSQRKSFPNVADAITGIVFLGTPHYGVDKGSVLSTQGAIYQAILGAKVRVQVEALQAMTQDNQLLHTIVQDFSRMIRSELETKPGISCFYELRGSRVGKIAGLDLPEEFVVTEASATMKGFDSIALDADHFSMNTFENNQDGNFIYVRQQIIQLEKTATDILKHRSQVHKSGQPKSFGVRSHPGHIPAAPIPLKPYGRLANRGDILGILDKKFLEGTVVALTGDLGHGKTHIAVEYAHRYAVDNPSSRVHWLDASTAEEFELSYRRVGESLNLHFADSATPQDIVTNVLQGLKEVKGHWLMVVDGLEEESTLRWANDPGLPRERKLWDLIPKRGRHTYVLITTRNKSLARSLVDPNQRLSVHIDRLHGVDAATIVLQQENPSKSISDSAIKLSERFGGNAGALEFVHAYCNRILKGATLGTYEKALDQVPWFQLFKPNPQRATVYAWRLIYKHLKEEKKEAAELLRCAGVLEVQSIPKAFFDKRELEHVKTLEEYGMMEQSADDRVMRVTGIVRWCLQDHLKEKGEKNDAEEKVLGLLCGYLRGDNSHNTVEVLLPTIHAALKFQTKSSSSKEWAATLHLKVAQYYQHIGRLGVAIRHFETCLKAHSKDANQSCFLSSEDSASARRALEEAKLCLKREKSPGMTQNSTSAPPPLPDAQKVHTELQHLEATCGLTHPSTVQKVVELAALRLTHPSIRNLFRRKAHNGARVRGPPAPNGHNSDIHGPSHKQQPPNIGTNPSLGPSQIPIHDMPVRRGSAAHTSPAGSLHIYGSQSFTSPPRSPHGQPGTPPPIQPTSKGEHEPDTHNTAVTPPPSEDTTDKNSENAACLYQRLLAIAMEKYGETDMFTADAHFSLALAHEADMNFPLSLKHFTDALDTARANVGINSPQYLRMMRALGCLYARQGNQHLPQAQQIFVYVLEKQTQLLGENHPETLITRHNVALCHEEAGNWEAAGEELKKILSLQRYFHGSDAQETLQTACSLAMNYAVRGKKESEELFKATLATQEQMLGTTHIDTLTTAERMREFREYAHGAAENGSGEKDLYRLNWHKMDRHKRNLHTMDLHERHLEKMDLYQVGLKERDPEKVGLKERDLDKMDTEKRDLKERELEKRHSKTLV